jgi:hypothetical protein
MRLSPEEQRLCAIADGLRLVDTLLEGVRQETDDAWDMVEWLASVKRHLLNEWELGS